MHYRALACDYDGTLATHGRIDSATLDSLEKFLASGRQLILVTGRELPELKSIFPELFLFSRVVAENGALLYHPQEDKERPLAEPPASQLIDELSNRRVQPISYGRVIIATWQPHEAAVLSSIKDLGLDYQVIFNKGAVMILPSGINKATGLATALREMQLSRHNVVAVGDAENDHAFLHYCRFGVAVANALPALKEHAELVTQADHGRGVSELIHHILSDDLQSWNYKLTRHQCAACWKKHGTVGWLPASQHLYVRGEDSAARSVIANVVQSIGEAGYQYCLFTTTKIPATGNVAELLTPSLPAGSAGRISTAMVGSAERLPEPDEVLTNLEHPEQDVHVQLIAGSTAEKAACLTTICDRLRVWRADSSRPHVVVFPLDDEMQELGLSEAELIRGFPSTIIAGTEDIEHLDYLPPGTALLSIEQDVPADVKLNLVSGVK